MSDLSPLRGMPLTTCGATARKVSDLSPLEGMRLTDVGFTPKNITKGLDIIRQMKSLKIISICGRKRYPRRVLEEIRRWRVRQACCSRQARLPRPRLPAWVKATQALPAEKQIEAVSKKLMELNQGFDGKLGGHAGKAKADDRRTRCHADRLNTDEVTDISPLCGQVGRRDAPRVARTEAVASLGNDQG